jgi:hypothetical protein
MDGALCWELGVAQSRVPVFPKLANSASPRKGAPSSVSPQRPLGKRGTPPFVPSQLPPQRATVSRCATAKTSGCTPDPAGARANRARHHYRRCGARGIKSTGACRPIFGTDATRQASASPPIHRVRNLRPNWYRPARPLQHPYPQAIGKVGNRGNVAVLPQGRQARARFQPPPVGERHYLCANQLLLIRC